ncbi:Maintenance of telomere capping protein 6 [Candida viswanathii]|uniref:Maintenance of telomere capping protein 6 n=1 Tax=Candida viswanathii TaxID=5486 RepID=A0A367XVX3_9ASCO|nr:Maintenance of telomere capping protein 6 [Candida viswanathii]
MNLIGYILLFVLIHLLTCTAEDSNWPSLNFTLEMATRSQRDIAKPLPLTQGTHVGIALSALFRNNDYTVDALSPLYDLLSGGNEALMIDLYWNEFTSQWQLCPAPFPSNLTYNPNDVIDLLWDDQDYKCLPGLSTENIMNIVNSYIRDTNTNIAANYLQILFNLKSIHYEKSNRTIDLENMYKPSSLNPMNIGNSTLNNTVASLGSFIFSPTVLEQYQEETQNGTQEGDGGDSVNSTQAISYFYNRSDIVVPSLETVLLVEYKRVLVHVVSNELVNSTRVYQFSDNDKNLIFFDNVIPSYVDRTSSGAAREHCQSLITSYGVNGVNVERFNNLSLTTELRYIVDNDETPFTVDTFSSYIRCGYSAIFNATYGLGSNSTDEDLLDVVNEFVPHSFWSWAPSQPANINDTRRGSDNETEENRDGGAFRCVVLTEVGWTVSNCYDKEVVACQNASSRNEWVLDNRTKSSYFDADCGDGLVFGVPRLALEMLSLVMTVRERNVSFPIWIDVNDLTVDGCYVSGGPYAQCPYQRTISTNKFIRTVAPPVVVAVVVLVLILIEKIFRSNPIQTNRKRYWKKAIQEYYNKNDFEGVPS